MILVICNVFQAFELDILIVDHCLFKIWQK